MGDIAIMSTFLQAKLLATRLFNTGSSFFLVVVGTQSFTLHCKLVLLARWLHATNEWLSSFPFLKFHITFNINDLHVQ